MWLRTSPGQNRACLLLTVVKFRLGKRASLGVYQNLLACGRNSGPLFQVLG